MFQNQVLHFFPDRPLMYLISVIRSARYHSNMKFTRRLGETQAAPQYPLPVSGPAKWELLESGLWQTSIALDDLPPEHILVPSFALIGAEYQYQFMLQHAAGENMLRPLPATSEAVLFPEHAENSAHLSDHIDCWHSENTITAAHLVLRVACETSPRNYLCVASARPLEISDTCNPVSARRLATPPAISQMAAASAIRKRICSPTALAMALAYLHRLNTTTRYTKLWTELVSDCYDPVTKAYGMWPQAIYQASRLNSLAAVECSTDWSSIEQALQNETPVICSIRFDAGELATAPLPRTAGHLVLVYGVSNSEVYVLDPAAADTMGVARCYDRQQFSAAWLRRRGAAYFFSQITADG
ncbi:MAG TPA: hypothetical protein DDZ32_00355 [Gammaproteobacteria bacterium]|nr:hypothetical protein [Gammaproteobacteria bacterium]